VDHKNLIRHVDLPEVHVMRERSDCTFFFITKRPERIENPLPSDWGSGWSHVTIAVTCENQWAADRRLPLYLGLPRCHRAVMVEPMLGHVNLRPYLETGKIEKEYQIPREYQHIQAHKAGLDFDGTVLLSMMPGE
jgi:protein gp37